MLKITKDETKHGTVLKLEGKLSGPWVNELQESWSIHRVAEGRPTPIRVNLREVTYVDGGGRELLIRMKREGASLVEASDFISHLLGEGVEGGGPSAVTLGNSTKSEAK